MSNSYVKGMKFHFFWDGPFSQWSSSPFFVRGIEYDCAEQFMMAAKAELFGDRESWQKIMDAKRRPDVQKALGRKVKGFDEKIWEQNAKLIVYRGTLAKFQQNAGHMAAMREVFEKGEHFVEASPYDKIWGIGLGVEHPHVNDPAHWRGTNWLGQVLDIVAYDLL
jgi:ribA/ribD-fused uncharacterized protein